MTDDTIYAGDVTSEVERFLRYEATLRKIAAWKGYRLVEGELANDYEEGANDMLVTLKQMAEEALAS